jgi:hypothetical protein
MRLPLRDYADIVTILKVPGRDLPATEQRGAARIAVEARVQMYLPNRDGSAYHPYTALTRDISLSGMGLLQSIALPEGSQVTASLPRPSTPLLVCCKVIQCRPLVDGLLIIGLSFEQILTEEQQTQLSRTDADERARVQRSILD